MELVNNRYRIIKNIKNTIAVTSYVASDILKNNEIKQINIIDSKNISNKLLKFYCKKFIKIANISTQYIGKAFNFGHVYSLDNKNIDDCRYYYFTNEYIDGNFNKIKYFNSLNEKEILDLFSEIASSINYLHLKGICYGEINIDNIIINFKLDKVNVKLKDLASVEMEKYMRSNNSISKIYFKPHNIIINDNLPCADIYSLGIFLFLLVSENNENFNDNLANIDNIINGNYHNVYKTSLSNEFVLNINKVIKKMISKKQDEKYEDIYELIADINKKFNKKYLSFNKSEVEKLCLKNEIIGRKNEINYIMNVCRSTSGIKMIGIHGEDGIGKTRLLKELKYVFKYEKYNVFNSFELENIADGNNLYPQNILKQIIAKCNNEVLKKYESELVKIIPQLNINNDIKYSKLLIEKNETFRKKNRFSSFIAEVIKNSPSAFIIDNLHLCNNFTFEFISYLFNELKDKNIIIIFTYSDVNPKQSCGFNTFLEASNCNENFIDMKLKHLNEEESHKLVQTFLGTDSSSINFSKLLYAKTFGNPGLMKEIIKYVFNEKDIFIDEVGIWEKAVKNIIDIRIPSNIKQIVLNQIRDIDNESRKVLEILAVYDFPATYEDIYLQYSFKQELNILLENLIVKEIVDEKVEDGVNKFEINNKLLKKLIYERINKKNRKLMHKRAADILMQKNNTMANDDKTIFHLEKAELQEEVKNYCIKYADKMNKVNNIDKEIKYLEKALSIFNEESNVEDRIKILIKLGKLYFIDGKNNKSIEYFYQSERISHENCKFKYQIDALNNLIQVYINKNEFDNALKLVKKVEKVTNSIEYREGLLETLYRKSILYLHKSDNKNTLNLCQWGLEKCTDEDDLYKGHFYNTIGIVKYRQSKSYEAEQAFDKCAKFFNNAAYYEGIAKSFINRGVIKAFMNKDKNCARDYFFKGIEICDKHKIIVPKINGLLNIAIIYQEDLDYNNSIKYLKESLEISERIQVRLQVFSCYIMLIKNYVYSEQYKEAYFYYSKAKNEMKNFTQNNRDVLEYYGVAAELNLELGDIKKAKNFISLALDKCSGYEEKLESGIYSIYELIKIGEVIDEENIELEVENYLNVIAKMNDSLLKKDFMYDTAILVTDNNKDFGKKIFNIANSINTESKSYKLKAKEIYLKAILKNEYDVDLLLNAYKIANKEKIIKLQWEICTSLGNYHLKKQEYYNAINYFLEACDKVKGLTLQLPKEIRLNYVKYHRMQEPFEKLIALKRNFYNELEVEIDEFRIKLKSYDELENLLNYKEVENLFDNKKLIKSAIKFYKSIMCGKINSVQDIVESIEVDCITNLQTICKYLASITLSSKCEIIVPNDDKELYILASSCDSKGKVQSGYIFDNVRIKRKALIINKDNKDMYDMGDFQQNIGRCAYIPIKVNDKDENQNEYNDRRKKYDENYIVGYIYIEADKLFNNINNSSVKKCIKLNKLIAFIIEKYNCKLTSSVDKLTGVYTRKYLERSFVKQIEKASDNNEKFSIIMFDIDNFKMVNDKYGHQTGDKVLCNICSSVLDNIRESDICGRYGGEEFIIILPNVDEENAYSVGEKLRKKIEENSMVKDNCCVTVSMGISTYPNHGLWMQELVEKADQALYKAKNMGKNTCKVWKKEFSNITNVTNKLSGIIGGNINENTRNVLLMVHIMELIKSNKPENDKIFELLGRIIGAIEAQYGSLIILEDGYIRKKYERKAFIDHWIQFEYYNKKIIESIITSKKGVYLVDWDNIVEYNSLTGEPYWYSIIAVPIIKSGELKGLLYITVPIKHKEFKYEDFNFINTLAGLIAGIF